MKENGLIIFLKLPSRGKVKTRLESTLGADFVFTLYTAFIMDTLKICRSVDADILLAYSPDAEAEEVYKPLLTAYRSYKQRGGDLGERMFNAFEDAYGYGYNRCVLIGSDIPEITGEIIDGAFIRLEKYDMVIGPSADGGYYLIGNNRRTNSIDYFMDIEWSRPEVFKNTEKRIYSSGYTLSFTEVLNDIDDIHDLRKFYETNKGNGISESIRVICENIDLTQQV